MARVAWREAGLAGITEHEAVTRDPATRYFEITPLARVPLLETDAGMLADTRDICARFEELAGRQLLFPPETPAETELRHVATGLLDTLAVWLREGARPVSERSERVRDYEMLRADRILPWLETRQGAVPGGSFTELTLTCTFDMAARRGLGPHWQDLAPTLAARCADLARRPAMQATEPAP